MKIELNRIAKRPTYTIGKMYINGVYTCDTIEDTVRDFGVNGEGKVKGQTAIPTGTYKVIMTYSNRFKKQLPLLVGVPYFEGVRIHSGNTEADTEGCILCGKNTEVGKVTSSRVYTEIVIRQIVEALKKEEVTITVK